MHKNRSPLSGLMGLALAVFLLVSSLVERASAAELDLDSAAALFGQMPSVWGMRLSPDGQKVSFLKNHKDDIPIALVLDLRTGEANLIAASDKKKGVDIVSCEWATNSRLLCRYFGIWSLLGDVLPASRLVAVNDDGKNMQVLMQRQQRKAEEFALNQSLIVDLLPDDPAHIWVQLREKNGMGVSRVDIERNRLKAVQNALNGVWALVSDGRGELRLRKNAQRTWTDWEYRLAGESQWRQLHRDRPGDDEELYLPVAVRPGSNELFVVGRHEGRKALFKEILTEDSKEVRKRELIYSHSEADVDQPIEIGKFRRIIGISYETEKRQVEYFDDRIRAINEIVSRELIGQKILFLDESWDQRFYLIHASSDVQPGAFYRYDSADESLSRVVPTYPWLEDVDLAQMMPIQYEATEGVSIRGYLTRPTDSEGPTPLIVLPHGGPSARDDWGYDWLPQFFASRGYAVLQANYRGSDGYGKEWLGDGGFHEWRHVVADIDSGVEHLVTKGIVDPKRVCIVGWSFGGYAALISALENPERYRCVVSVAGVTHPAQLVKDVWRYNFLEKQEVREFVPTKGEDVVQGSPLKRAKEMPVPVQLFHGDRDLNVHVDHSRDLENALRKAGKRVDYVEYEGADHSISRQRHRIEMFQRMGDFLDEHLGGATMP